MRRTKIVATLGPSTSTPEQIRALLEAGVDVVRLNFAHGAREEHAAAVQRARAAADDLGRVVGVLADLPGPKMRTGLLQSEMVTLATGATFMLTRDQEPGDRDRVSTSVPELASMVSEGEEIFLADGAIILRTEAVRDGNVMTTVVRGGNLRSRKGMHVPSAERAIEAFTQEDERALAAAVEMEVDLVGLSFIRDAEDMQRARSALPEIGHRPHLVAKIETRSAVENLRGIVREADAVMVARGDLGIQLPVSRVPHLQKRIISACNKAGKPVITATQMLESMTRAPLPTRAEVADVANAVLDGTDALMLSEETAVGHHPMETVLKMVEIAEEAEAAKAELMERRAQPLRADMYDDPMSWAVAHAAVQAAADLSVSAILCPTRTGSTPMRVAAFRPAMRIVALSEVRSVLGALCLTWGVTPLPVGATPPDLTAEEDVERACAACLGAGIVRPREHVAIVAGTPGNPAGTTDYVRLVKVG